MDRRNPFIFRLFVIKCFIQPKQALKVQVRMIIHVSQRNPSTNRTISPYPDQPTQKIILCMEHCLISHTGMAKARFQVRIRTFKIEVRIRSNTPIKTQKGLILRIQIAIRINLSTIIIMQEFKGFFQLGIEEGSITH